MTARRLFTEVFWNYFLKKLLENFESSHSNRTKIINALSLNSVIEASMSLPKNVSNNFTKRIFYIRDMIKINSD